MLEIRSVHSPDIPNLRSWRPEDPERVKFLLELEIGTEGDTAADVFDALIVTPGALQHDFPDEEMIIASRGIIVTYSGRILGTHNLSIDSERPCP